MAFKLLNVSHLFKSSFPHNSHQNNPSVHFHLYEVLENKINVLK